jgi:hypothetical protein
MRVEPAAAPEATGEAQPEGPRCSNCGAAISGAFCPQCGQETNLKLPTLREFLREAAGRYVAFDGRFWRTMFALVFRPGRLTREYFAGRRRRYIRPARLYLFATLVFFAVSRFFTPGHLFNVETDVRPDAAQSSSPAKIEPAQPQASGKRARPPAESERLAEPENGLYIDDDLDLHVPEGLPGGSTLKNRWQRFERLSRSEKGDQIVDGMLRYGPYAMFVLLPAFALLLKFAYLGRHRRYPHRPRLFGEHMVYGAHIHAFFFVAATAVLLAPSGWLRAIVEVWMVFYFFRSLRVIYAGSRSGTAVRALFLFVGYSVVLGIATGALVVAAVLLR